MALPAAHKPVRLKLLFKGTPIVDVEVPSAAGKIAGLGAAPGAGLKSLAAQHPGASGEQSGLPLALLDYLSHLQDEPISPLGRWADETFQDLLASSDAGCVQLPPPPQSMAAPLSAAPVSLTQPALKAHQHAYQDQQADQGKAQDAAPWWQLDSLTPGGRSSEGCSTREELLNAPSPASITSWAPPSLHAHTHSSAQQPASRSVSPAAPQHSQPQQQQAAAPAKLQALRSASPAAVQKAALAKARAGHVPSPAAAPKQQPPAAAASPAAPQQQRKPATTQPKAAASRSASPVTQPPTATAQPPRARPAEKPRPRLAPRPAVDWLAAEATTIGPSSRSGSPAVQRPTGPQRQQLPAAAASKSNLSAKGLLNKAGGVRKPSPKPSSSGGSAKPSGFRPSNQKAQPQQQSRQLASGGIKRKAGSQAAAAPKHVKRPAVQAAGHKPQLVKQPATKPQQPTQHTGQQRRQSDAQDGVPAGGLGSREWHGLREGQVVWAKMAGFPAWPAQVQAPPPEAMRRPSGITRPVFVVFFGTQDFQWLSASKLSPFAECYKARARSKDWQLQAALDAAWWTLDAPKPQL